MKKVNFCITEDTMDKLDFLTKKTGMKKSNLIDKLICDYFNKMNNIESDKVKKVNNVINEAYKKIKVILAED